MKKYIEPILMITTGFIVGFIAMQQVYLKSSVKEITDPKKTAALALEVQELINNDGKLRDEFKTLESQKNDFENLSSDNSTKENILQKELDELRIITGSVAVKGPGVEIEFTDQLEVSQIVDIINALHNIGAEVISLNDKRIIASSGISPNSFSAPYKFAVIGKPEILSNALKRRGGILEQIGVDSKVSEKTDVKIPKV